MHSYSNMENLLTNNFVSHYNIPLPTTNWAIKTQERYFEVEDTNAGEIQLHTSRGAGMAKFSNQDTLELTIINYDGFITSIPDEVFKSGRKRCDILVTCNTDRYFILGEIKDRSVLNQNTQKNVRKEAKKQLISSLNTILAVPEIISYLNLKVVKRCCYFNKQSASPIILSATTAFNRLLSFYPEGFKMSNPDMENLGFEFYEYTGEQTMVLKN